MLAACLIAIVVFCFIMAELMISGSPRVGRSKDPVVAAHVVRGTIYDRNGRVLAVEIPQNNLYVRSNDPDAQIISQILALHLNRTPEEIFKDITAYGNAETVRIASGLTAEESYVVEEDLRKNNIPEKSVRIEKQYVRTYPAAFHAAQLIQETESVFEKVLKPIPEYDKSTTYGNDVYLTVDLDIQYLLDLATQQIFELQSPDYSVAFILDAASGEVLASTTYPFYDLNYSSSIPETQKINRTLVSFVSRPEIRVTNIKVVSKVLNHENSEKLTSYGLNGDYTKDLEVVRDMINNADGFTSTVSGIPAEEPKYLVFIGSVNARFYRVSSVLEYAVSSLEEGLAAQNKL